MRELSSEEVRQLMTEMLQDIADFSMDHNLQLFLLGGTLLGEVRDNSIIKWDDDIDIGLKRADYEKLSHIYTSKHDEYCLLTEDNERNYFPYMRLVNENTVLKSEYYQQTHGIFIDIFPIDEFDKNSWQLGQYFMKHKILNVLRNIERSTGVYPKEAKLPRMKEFLRKALPSISPHKIAQLEIRQVNKFVGKPKHASQSGVLNGVYGKKEVFPVSMWRHAKKVNFLNFSVWQVDDYDQYLTQFFGDWRVEVKDEGKHGTFYLKETDK